MGNPNKRLTYEGGAQEPEHLIDARAPYANPMKNKGANPASPLIRMGWGWEPFPDAGSDALKRQWGWDKPPKQMTPDFFKKPVSTDAAGADVAGKATNGASPEQPQGQNSQKAPAQTQQPPQTTQPQEQQQSQPQGPDSQKAPDPMLAAMQTSPFSNGKTLPQNMDPTNFRHTGAGYETQMNSGSGPRWVSVTPTPDQVFNARTQGQWATMSPDQRGQYLRTGALPQQQVGASLAAPDMNGHGGVSDYLNPATRQQAASPGSAEPAQQTAAA